MREYSNGRLGRLLDRRAGVPAATATRTAANPPVWEAFARDVDTATERAAYVVASVERRLPKRLRKGRLVELIATQIISGLGDRMIEEDAVVVLERSAPHGPPAGR